MTTIQPIFSDTKTGFRLDLSGMFLDETAWKAIGKADKNGVNLFKKAMAGIQAIEAGEIKNPDENRKVTHFTDRLTYCQSQLYRDVEEFAKKLRRSPILPNNKRCEYVIINGIGGSALGPQLMQFAINGPYWNEQSRSQRVAPRIYFLDNTDTAGVIDALKVIKLPETVVITISKSGGTQETANNMIVLQAAYQAAGLNFADYAVAVTMEGSKLDKIAKNDRWLAVFPMADSIGGRTSETAIVGHVPAAVTRINFKKFINGACYMDKLTRKASMTSNPAMMLASAWYLAGNGKGDRNMVIVPYSDRLILFARYLQQLVMESLGKEKDSDGNIVEQGLNVFGNKGGTDAHAFIQQLNDGRNDFFATFIEILQDSANLQIEGNTMMGDYLHGFKEGLVAALRNKGRQSAEIIIEKLDEFALGMLIALYERAVAIYAEMININAFHQPGVQAYKLAAGNILKLAEKVQGWIAQQQTWTGTAEDIANALNMPEETAHIDGLMAKYAINQRQIDQAVITMTWQNNQRLFTING